MTVEIVWTPPAGMAPQRVRQWREFFRAGLTGKNGYKATPEQYITMYKAQLGRCYICQRVKGINPEDPKAQGSTRLGWDHNHATGALRGLLCVRGENSCNRIVGHWKDNPEAFRRGARYLEQPPALVLAQVQRVAADLPVEDRIRLATEILGVEREAMESKVRRASLTQGMAGYTPTVVLKDETRLWTPPQ